MENLAGWNITPENVKILTEVLAFFVTVITGVCAIIKYYQDRRDKQLSEYIKSFSDNDKKMRLSGVNGLVRHASIMFKELFYLCALEKDALIQGLLWDELIKVCNKKKRKCGEINNFFVRRLLRKDTFIDSIDDKEKRNRMWKYVRSDLIDDPMENKKDLNFSNILNKDDAAVEMGLLLSTQLIAEALNRSACRSLKGVIFTKSSLRGAQWTDCSLKNSAMVTMWGSDIRGKRIRIEKVFLWDNNFPKGQFSMLQCKKLDIYKTDFTESVFKNVSLQGGDYKVKKITKLHKGSDSVLDSITFDRSKFDRIKVVCYQIKKVKWNDCVLNRCHFTDVKFTANNWHGEMACTHSKFYIIKFYGEELHGTFDDCCFENVEWRNSNLQGTQFKNCTFININFFATDMVNVKFVDCVFENTNVFKGTQNMDPKNIIGKNASAYIQANKV